MIVGLSQASLEHTGNDGIQAEGLVLLKYGLLIEVMILSLHPLLLLWYDMIWYDVMWCDVMWCDVMWGEVRWGEVRWGEVRWGEVRWDEMRWDWVRWGAMKTEICGSHNFSPFTYLSLPSFTSATAPSDPSNLTDQETTSFLLPRYLGAKESSEPRRSPQSCPESCFRCWTKGKAAPLLNRDSMWLYLLGI